MGSIRYHARMSVPARQPRRLWRLAAAGIICLLIGTAVNVLVAWGSEWVGTRYNWPTPRSVVETHPGKAWPFPLPEGAHHTNVRTYFVRLLWIDLYGVRYTNGRPLIEQGDMTRREYGDPGSGCTVGLPFRCLGSYDLGPNSPHLTRYSLDLPGNFRATMRTHVLWPGFAANTLIYAALAYGLSWLPFMARRWRRGRRNQCPNCGYDRAGLAADANCPECGAERAATSGTMPV